MDYLEQAQTLYRKRHVHAAALSDSDRDNLAMAITRLVRSSLTQQGGMSCFRYLPFISVIQKTVASGRFQGRQAAAAFLELEKYMLLLLGQPWKREFWLLKTYGGYFRTKVKSHLEEPEEILQLVGYMTGEEVSSSSTYLILQQAPDTEVVLHVAFDCQVAAEECRYIGDYHDQMRCMNLSLMDVMSVLLSGTSVDPVHVPLPASTTPALQGGNNSNNMGGHPDGALVKHQGASHRDMTATQALGLPPGMGREGVTGGMNLGHPMAGVPAAAPHALSHQPLNHVGPGFTHLPQPLTHTYQNMAEHLPVAGGLKVEAPPQLPPSAVVGDAGFRQVPGSRSSYASSAQSSGYVSGSVSVMSNRSSAYGVISPFLAPSSTSGHLGSSGPHLPSPAPPGYYSYGFPAQPVNSGGGDQVDSPAMNVPLPQPPPASSSSPRHSAQLFPPHTHRPPPVDFPFMDDDVESAPSPLFPQAVPSQAVGGQVGGGSVVEPEVVMRRPAGSRTREGAAVSFGEWRPVQWDGKAGAGGVMGARSSSSMVHRPTSSQQSSDVTRVAPGQPATAVLAMLNTSLAVEAGQHYPPPPLPSVAGGAPRDSPSNTPQDSSSHPYGDSQPPPHPVYFPPDASPGPCPLYSNTVCEPGPQKTPTFAQVAASGKATDSQVLLSRQAQGSAAVPTPQGSVAVPTPAARPEKGPLAKSIVSTGRSGAGSSSEVILREKMVVKPGGTVRGSSLVTPSSSGQRNGISRQSSQSMDLGMLKWRCPACTMENWAAHTICSTCSKSRNAPGLKFPAAGESKRMCPACTFENQPGRSACEMCETALTDVHTYV